MLDEPADHRRERGRIVAVRYRQPDAMSGNQFGRARHLCGHDGHLCGDGFEAHVRKPFVAARQREQVERGEVAARRVDAARDAQVCRQVVRFVARGLIEIAGADRDDLHAVAEAFVQYARDPHEAVDTLLVIEPPDEPDDERVIGQPERDACRLAREQHRRRDAVLDEPDAVARDAERMQVIGFVL